MPLSMYEASAPVFLRALANLRAVLAKGEAHAVARGIAPEVLLLTRLTPEMFPLQRQVQIATDMARNGASRLAGAALIPIDDTETTFAQLDARIDRAMAQIAGYTAVQIDGSEAREIVVKSPRGEMTFSGQSYLLDFVLPNLFFHSTAAYAILRQAGVALGKADFIGARG